MFCLNLADLRYKHRCLFSIGRHSHRWKCQWDLFWCFKVFFRKVFIFGKYRFITCISVLMLSSQIILFCENFNNMKQSELGNCSEKFALLKKQFQTLMPNLSLDLNIFWPNNLACLKRTSKCHNMRISLGLFHNRTKALDPFGALEIPAIN